MAYIHVAAIYIMANLTSHSAFERRVLQSSFPGDDSIESKMALFKTELKFYWQLVSWLTFVSSEECLPALQQYKAELSVLRKIRLPALENRMQHLHTRQSEGQRAALAQLWRQLFRTVRAFELLKYDLQHRFIEFIHVSIW